MKRLEKNFKKNRNTIEAFKCGCDCYCPCAYCASTWISQNNADLGRVAVNSDNRVLYS